MENMLINDLSFSIMDISQIKYPKLYEMMSNGTAYLCWDKHFSELEYPEKENNKVSLYSKKSNEYIGTFSFKARIKKVYMVEGNFYSNYIVESSLKFKTNKRKPKCNQGIKW